MEDTMVSCRFNHVSTIARQAWSEKVSYSIPRRGYDQFRRYAFFRCIGVNLKQLYASTEGGLLAMHREGEEDPETLGPPLDQENIKVNEGGEVISRREVTFSGYYKNEEDYKKTVMDGWFHTGDAVMMNERGHFIYLDRVKNLIDLPGGQKFAPEYVSSRLRFTPYIKDALVIGGGVNPFISAIVILNYENVGDWAAKNLISYSTYADLSQKLEVMIS
jgi:long-chain acyl-CoA synthetase